MQLIPSGWMPIVEAVLSIALMPNDAPVRSAELAAQLALAPRHLEARLQKLVRAGLLKSLRGPRGGYVLARERRLIRLIDIIAGAEGMSEHRLHAALRAGLAADGARATAPTLLLAPLWMEMGERMLAQLERTTLADLCTQAAQRRLIAPDAAQTRLDYAI